MERSLHQTICGIPRFPEVTLQMSQAASHPVKLSGFNRRVPPGVTIMNPTGWWSHIVLQYSIQGGLPVVTDFITPITRVK